MNISIQIKNLPQIKKAFNTAPQLMRTNLNQSIRKAITLASRESRILTPVDTGTLRASHRETFSDLYGEVGTHTKYDVFVHEGTRFMKGRPYLRNAIERTDPQIQAFFTKAVDQTLDSVGKMT